MWTPADGLSVSRTHKGRGQLGAKLGMERCCTDNTGSYGSTTWATCPNCKDVSLNLEAAKRDVTTRAN